MKVKIGDYVDWFGPYHFVELFTPIFGEKRIDQFEETELFDKLSDWSMPFFKFIDKFRKRKIKIHIDDFDVYSMDHTLSLIIVPMLEKLQEKKEGSPFVDDKDVPEELRSTADKDYDPDNNDGDLDKFYHKRWEWVLNEMLFAMKNIRDDNWQEQFHHGKSDFIEKKIETEDTVYFEITEGPNHTATIDKEGMKKYADRIQNGTRLFGKYFQNLWW